MPDAPPAADAEDAKLVTLAKATRARTGAIEAAAVRDGTGRTYVAAAVALPSLRLPALDAAVVVALASGAQTLEAAALVRPDGGAPVELAAVRDLGGAAVVVIDADPAGAVRAVLRVGDHA